MVAALVRAVPRRGPTRRILGKCVDPGRWAVSRSAASPSPHPAPGRPVSARPPPRRGRKPRVPLREPPPRPRPALLRLRPPARAPRGGGRGAGRGPSCGRSGHVGPARRLLPAGAEQDGVGGAAAAARAAPGGLGRLRLRLVGAGRGKGGGTERAPPPRPCGVPGVGRGSPCLRPRALRGSEE